MLIVNLSKYSEGSEIEGEFLLLSTSEHIAKNGNPYIVYHFFDKDTIVFRSSPVFVSEITERMKLKNMKVTIKGEIEKFNETYMFKIQNFTNFVPLKDDEIFEIISNSIDGNIVKEYTNRIEQIEDGTLKTAAFTVFNRYKKPLIITPAAKDWHDNGIGGLLKHLIKVYDLVIYIVKLLNIDSLDFSLDVVKFASLFHDIGKIFEYELSEGKVTKSKSAHLFGHLYIGAKIISEILNNHPLKYKIEHCILSHHGEIQYGAIQKPSILEAIVLYYADLTEANISGYKTKISKLISNDTQWINYKNQYVMNLSGEINGEPKMFDLFS